jgi:hypothetical protein
VQDLVRVGVADAAQQARIGQGSLDGVVLPGQGRAEIVQVRAQHLEAARIVVRQPRLAAHHVEPRPLLLAGLRQQQAAVGEVEGRQPAPPGHGHAGLPPAQAARDHQVQHDEQRPIEGEHDPLAQPPHSAHSLPGHRRDRRLHRTEQERATQPNSGERLVDHPRTEGVEIDLDVG